MVGINEIPTNVKSKSLWLVSIKPSAQLPEILIAVGGKQLQVRSVRFFNRFAVGAADQGSHHVTVLRAWNVGWTGFNGRQRDGWQRAHLFVSL
ncbi:hypothetical protein N9980_02015 [bacterium]|nr:hypothetical protein [bacterium]